MGYAAAAQVSGSTETEKDALATLGSRVVSDSLGVHGAQAGPDRNVVAARESASPQGPQDFAPTVVAGAPQHGAGSAAFRRQQESAGESFDNIQASVDANGGEVLSAVNPTARVVQARAAAEELRNELSDRSHVEGSPAGALLSKLGGGGSLPEGVSEERWAATLGAYAIARNESEIKGLREDGLLPKGQEERARIDRKVAELEAQNAEHRATLEQLPAEDRAFGERAAALAHLNLAAGNAGAGFYPLGQVVVRSDFFRNQMLFAAAKGAQAADDFSASLREVGAGVASAVDEARRVLGGGEAR